MSPDLKKEVVVIATSASVFNFDQQTSREAVVTVSPIREEELYNSYVFT